MASKKATYQNDQSDTLLAHRILWSGVCVAIFSIVVLVTAVAGHLTNPGPRILQTTAEQPEPLEINPLPVHTVRDTVTIRTYRRDREPFASAIAAGVAQQGGYLLSRNGRYHNTYVVPRHYAAELSNLTTNSSKKLPTVPRYVGWANRQSKAAPARAAHADTSVTIKIVSRLIERPAVAWIIGIAGSGLGMALAMFTVFVEARIGDSLNENEREAAK